MGAEEYRLDHSPRFIERETTLVQVVGDHTWQEWTGREKYKALQTHFMGQPGAVAKHLGVLARQKGPGGWVQTAVERLTQFIIADTAKPTEQRVIKGPWAGNKPDNKHIGQEACEQEELRGFTKRQVHTKRYSMNEAGLVKIKVPKVKVPKV